MKFRKNMKLGVSIIFLLLIFTTSISFINLSTKNNVVDKDSLSVSALDDSYEPNNNYSQAFDLSPFEGIWLSSINGTGIQADDDFYEIYIFPGYEFLKVNLSYFNTIDVINITICDNSGVPIKNGNEITLGNEYVDFKVPYSGTFYIKVFGYNTSTNYDLWWISLLPSFGGGDDLYEMNNIPENAYWLGEDEQTWLSDLHGMAVQGDDDWYAIEVTPGFLNLEVKLNFTRALGNIFMTIHFLEVQIDPFGKLTWNIVDQGIGSFSFNNREYINEPHLNSGYGIYLIEVKGVNDDNEYNLWWDTNKTRFGDDYFEENDNLGDAYDITDFEVKFNDHQPREEDNTGDSSANVDRKNIIFLALEIFLEKQRGISRIDFGVQLDDDFYKIEIHEGFEHLKVLIKYDYAKGQMGLELYDQNMNMLKQNFTLSDNDYIDYVVPSNGTYYIRVYGDNTGNFYNLFWTAMENENIEEIPGYDLLIVLGAIIGVSTIIIKKKRSKIKHN